MIRSLSIEIIKPVNCSWDQAGDALRQVYKATTAGANLAQTLALRADTEAFGSVGWQPAGFALPKNDKGKLDLPKFPKVDTEVYKFLTTRFPFVSTRAMNNVSRDAVARYRRDRLKIMVGSRSAPTYRSFPISTDMCSIREEGDGLILTISLLSKQSTLDCPMRVEFLLSTRKLKGEYRQVLQEIIDGDRDLTTVKLVHLKRKKKWMVHIPYEREAKAVELVSGRSMDVFPPGGGVFLRCEYRARKPKPGELPSKDDVWFKDIEHESMERSRKAYERRARAMSRKYAQDSSTGAIGHGRTRAIKHKSDWQEKYQRACKTFNQQRAAFIVKLALQWKCSIIRYVCPDDIPLEGFNLFESWPWYQLEQCIAQKAEENGIKFVKIDDKESLEAFVGRFDGNLCETA